MNTRIEAAKAAYLAYTSAAKAPIARDASKTAAAIAAAKAGLVAATAALTPAEKADWTREILAAKAAKS